MNACGLKCGGIDDNRAACFFKRQTTKIMLAQLAALCYNI